MTGARRALRAWRAARVTAITDFGQPATVVTPLLMVATQLMLTYWLWQALYAHVHASAGLTARQATTYALLGVLYLRFRQQNRWPNGDAMQQLMLEGTILYWFVRPVSPRRYYLIRTAGDLAYGGMWAVLGYGTCLAAGAVSPPASPASALAALATMTLGLVVLYYVQVCVDLSCSWSAVNDQTTAAAQFVVNLLAGAFAPVWYFPAWFQRADQFLPFQATLNVPLSLYVGRLPAGAVYRQAALQVAWAAALATLTWWLWRRAAARVTVLGG
jgi:ABC-2 type transport system permease protein